MSTPRRVLITGAFGTIGRDTVPALCELGFEVTATDVRTPTNQAVESDLHRRCRFDTQWVDIANAGQVTDLVKRVAPASVIHLASLIPPHIYADPERAKRINLEGTRHLVEAAKGLAARPVFVQASSHTVHGHRNCSKDLPLLRPDDARKGCDLYTRIKISCEDLVRESGLPWTILRYGIIFPKVYSKRIDPNAVRLSFLVPLETRFHGVHSEDAGYATARCAEGLAVNKVLMIGGGERWKQRQPFFLGNILDAVGVGMLPESAFARPDPAVEESWYYVDWMDTAEGQALLGYQRHEPEDYFRALAKDMGLLRPLARLASPLVRRQMAQLSPFYGGRADPRTPGMDLDERIRRFATPAARR